MPAARQPAAGAAVDSLGVNAQALSIRDTVVVHDTVVDRQTSRAAEPSENTQTWAQLLTTFACLVLFVLVFVSARWHHIARSVHAMIVGQLAALTTRLETEVSGCHPERLAALKAMVKSLSDEWAEGPAKRTSIMEVFYWSRGRENATWVVIHEVERQLAAYLAPPAQIDAYLIWADAELRSTNRPSALPLADAIRTSLALPAAPNDHERHQREEMRKALLGRAVATIYADRDASFSTLMEWQNKAGWLILAALIIIGFLTVAAGHGTLFLAGAAGGFLGRLMRALKREDVPLDYGASWTTLFLSPLLGALAGWFGVAMITLAADPHLNLLGDAFRLVQWGHPTAPATLAIAFLLGFSERLFDSIVGAIERHATPNDEASQARATAIAAARKPLASVALPGAPRVGAANGDPASVPAITAVERQRRAAGATQDALLVKGTGFATDAAVRINGAERRAEPQSADALLVPLLEADLMLIETGADFLVVVANPGGASSAPFDYA
jgi:hypothetical protein